MLLRTTTEKLIWDKICEYLPKLKITVVKIIKFGMFTIIINIIQELYKYFYQVS